MELKRLKIFFIFMTAYSIVFNILHGLIYKTVQERISDQAFLFNIFEGIYLLISLIPILIIIKILFKNIINDDVLNTVIYILFLSILFIIYIASLNTYYLCNILYVLEVIMITIIMKIIKTYICYRSLNILSYIYLLLSIIPYAFLRFHIGYLDYRSNVSSNLVTIYSYAESIISLIMPFIGYFVIILYLSWYGKINRSQPTETPVMINGQSEGI
jgi:hypothetical protein